MFIVKYSEGFDMKVEEVKTEKLVVVIAAMPIFYKGKVHIVGDVFEATPALAEMWLADGTVVSGEK